MFYKLTVPDTKKLLGVKAEQSKIMEIIEKLRQLFLESHLPFDSVENFDSTLSVLQSRVTTNYKELIESATTKIGKI